MTDEQENNKIEEEVAESAESSNDEYQLASGDNGDFKWYIAKTMTGQENKVVKTLKERIVGHKLSEYFAEVLSPEETVVSNINGKKRTIKKKFYPGYVLIKMVMSDRTWHLVKNTDKITGFVGGTSDRPTPLSNEEAAAMTQQAAEGFARPRTSINLSEGDTVKVIEGPFAAFVGTIESVSDKGKIKVSVSIFGRPTPVELDFTQVERIV